MKSIEQRGLNKIAARNIILHTGSELLQRTSHSDRDGDVKVWNIGTSSAASDLSEEVRFEPLKSQKD